MPISNVPEPVFTATGITLPTDLEILAGVQADINAAFGGGLDQGLSTPQGQLASSQTAIISDANALFAQLVSQVNPDYADGRMQDAIARIYYLDRKPATSTTVSCVCIGLAGVTIPVGAQARDTSGVVYASTEGGVIPIGGTLTLTFAALTTGPVPCAANTLTQIYQAIPGWDTINNPAPGIAGTTVETRAEFAFRRQNSVALNAHGSLNSIYAAVFAVDGVTDVYATENVTNAAVNVGSTSYSVLPHSLYVAVSGGLATSVARAIWLKKDIGCDYNGNTSVIITDTNYSPPQPTYTVKFQTPAALPIKFAVQIATNPSLPSDIVARVQAAIIAAFTGADGGTRARIGATIFASRFYAGVATTSPVANIVSILLGAATPTLTSQTVGIDQAPTIQASDIAVTLV